jgi:hypothetical protein
LNDRFNIFIHRDHGKHLRACGGPAMTRRKVGPQKSEPWVEWQIGTASNPDTREPQNLSSPRPDPILYRLVKMLHDYSYTSSGPRSQRAPLGGAGTRGLERRDSGSGSPLPSQRSGQRTGDVFSTVGLEEFHHLGQTGDEASTPRDPRAKITYRHHTPVDRASAFAHQGNFLVVHFTS